MIGNNAAEAAALDYWTLRDSRRGRGMEHGMKSAGTSSTHSDAVPSGEPVVLVVDDDISVRESLEALIRFGGWRVETFDSARAFLARPPEFAPSCLLLDVNLPDLSGLDLQQSVAAEQSYMPIVFITGYGDVPTTVKAMKAGAVEFLTKPFDTDVMLDAIRGALERSRAALASEVERLALQACCESLSSREREVMALVVAGLLNKQVGAELGISEITVKAHRGNVMRKMRAGSLPDLVHMATRLGVRRPAPK
jgi:FixJ family two-component response regulator